MALNLERFLNAKSIAIVGASSDLDKIGGQPIKYLLRHRYGGKIYPVNPRYKEIANLPCYPRVQDIPDQVDLAVLMVSAKGVEEAIAACVDSKVPFGVVCASGFSEMGADGKNMEGKMKALANSGGMRLVGPNCQGVVNVHTGLVGGFNPSLNAERLPPGNISVISQSGGLGYGFLSRGIDAGLGFRYIITTGNEADLTVTDFLDVCLQDDLTQVIVLAIEGIRDGEKLLSLLDRHKPLAKPVIVLKVGRTEAGKQAAKSHTGALSGSSETYNSLFKKYNLLSVDDLEQAVDLAKILGRYPRLGNRVAVITMSGGTGIIAVDAAAVYGLEVPEMSAATKDRLREIVPAYGSVHNPVDVTGQIFNDESMFLNTIKCLTEAPEIDTIIITIGPTAGAVGERFAAQISEIQKTSKPILVSWSSWSHNGHEILHRAAVPLFYSPLNLFYAMGKVAAYSQKAAQGMPGEAAATVDAASAAKLAKSLEYVRQTADFTEYEAKQLLRLWGVCCTDEVLAKTALEAKAAAAGTLPAAVKLMSPDIWHKTEAGLVKLHITSSAEVEKTAAELLATAYRDYPQARIQGVLVQEMVMDGTEVIIGIQNDGNFGPLLMFGAGGIYVELYKDVSFRLLPATKEEIRAMIQETKVYRLLTGYRGSERADIDSLVDTIHNIAAGFMDCREELASLDVNPIKVLPAGSGVKVVDAMIGKKA